LLSVATRFLMDVEFGGDDIQSRVVEFMATSHESVDAMGEEYIYIYPRNSSTHLYDAEIFLGEWSTVHCVLQEPFIEETQANPNPNPNAAIG